MQAHEEQDYTRRLDTGLWRRLLGHLKPYHHKLRMIVLYLFICAACDALLPFLFRYAIDHFIQDQTLQGLPLFLVASVALVGVQVFTIYHFLLLSGQVECGACYTLRKLGFQRLQELPFAYFDRMPVGFLMSRMTTDAQRLADTVGWSLLDLCWGACYVVLTGVAMFLLDWRLALPVALALPVLTVICLRFQAMLLESYRKVRKTNSQITGAFNEGIMGAKTTKTLVREDRNMQEFAQLTDTMRTASIRAAVISALYMPIVVGLAACATAYAMWQGGVSVMVGGMTLGTIQVFVNYTVNFFDPVRQIARILAELQSAQAAGERVLSLLETQPAIVDTPQVQAEYGDNFHPRRENWPPIRGEIDFDRVSFHYEGGEDVLKDFTLHVGAGQTIALVGETGAGKSTIVNLLCRFYEPTGGNIRIDGVDYRQRSQLWMQSSLGYVLQQPHLFSGTIRQNIRYGMLHATDAQVEAAARLVGADDFIARLDKGYDTPVGEGGNRLSTGEKQLVSFARAILADPRIFVLDEATSSVDTQAEQRIQQAIRRVLTGRTAFIVAHRLSTVRAADRILVISEGRIAEQGTHTELIRARGHYYRLYTNQFQEQQEAAILDTAASAE
ncbi:MAG: ABC transporter ATP-binding protein/permease [Oscillospiraceae bacterium]|jgi:ATP-binding cassette subfamily B protein|nr:ABC transporter ATP-binding protein/permease [Oscillospiraceae bacterium]